MKKIFAVLLSTLMVAGLFAGCGSKNEDGASAGAEMKEGNTVQTVVEKIDSEIGIAMGAQIDDMLLKDLFYIDVADTDAYFGLLSMANVSADNVMAIKAKPEKKDAVVEALNKRLADIQNSFANYLPEQSEKAQKGRVVEKGNYVFLLVLGESTETYDTDMENALKIIDEAF